MKTTKKRFIKFIMFLILMISGFIFLNLKTTFFNVKHIEVIGSSELTIEQVQIASGINLDNIFRLKSSEIENNLKEHPYIKDAKLKKRFPNKVLISIIERKEVLEIIDLDTYVYVDEDGKVLKILSMPLDKQLPVLKGPKVKSYQIGQSITFENELEIDMALKILGVSEELGYLEDIEKMVIESENKIFIDTNLGIKVAFGDEYKIKYKISFMHEILNTLAEKNITAGTLYLNKGEDPVFVPQDQ